MTLPIRSTLLLVIAMAAIAGAQSFQPMQSGTVLLGDRFGDQIWALNDFNFDGDTEDPGECVPWYTGANGPFLGTIQDMACLPNGVVLVIDSSADAIVSLIDLNLDGDADDVGESNIFFDLTNAGGIQAGSMMGITTTTDPNPRILVANSSNSAAPRDMVITMRDLNQDGDANDANEARVLWDKTASMANGGPDLDIPAGVMVLRTGETVVLHGAGGTTVAPRGIYQLKDNNFDGDTNDAGEVTPYYLLPAVTTPISFDMTERRAGGLYVVDRGTADTIYKVEDLNNDGMISGAAEAYAYWNAGVPSLVDNMCEVVAFDGAHVLLIAEDSSPDRLIGLTDLNGNGSIDNPTEQFTIHDTSVAGVVDFGQPKALEALPGPFLDGPSVVNIGDTFITTHTSVAAHTLFIGFSPVVPAIFAPPYGIYHLGVFPPPVLSVPLALVPASGVFSVSSTVPTSGVLSGIVLNVQSYDYDGFFGRLSNLYQLTIM